LGGPKSPSKERWWVQGRCSPKKNRRKKNSTAPATVKKSIGKPDPVSTAADQTVKKVRSGAKELVETAKGGGKTERPGKKDLAPPKKNETSGKALMNQTHDHFRKRQINQKKNAQRKRAKNELRNEKRA